MKTKQHLFSLFSAVTEDKMADASVVAMPYMKLKKAANPFHCQLLESWIVQGSSSVFEYFM